MGTSGKYEHFLAPSLERFGLEPVFERRDQRSIFEAYNSLADQAQGIADLEGLILLHDDVEVLDASLEEKLRAAFVDESVGVVGVVGGRHPKAMSWWETDQLFGRVRHGEHHFDDFTIGQHDVDVVDGLFMALSPAVVRQLRFEGQGYPGFHGYDSEICAVVRRAGMTVVVTDIELYHHAKPASWGTWAYRQALYTYQLRWLTGSFSKKTQWRAKRLVLRTLAVREASVKSVHGWASARRRSG